MNVAIGTGTIVAVHATAMGAGSSIVARRVTSGGMAIGVLNLTHPSAIAGRAPRRRPHLLNPVRRASRLETSHATKRDPIDLPAIGPSAANVAAAAVTAARSRRFMDPPGCSGWPGDDIAQVRARESRPRAFVTNETR